MYIYILQIHYIIHNNYINLQVLLSDHGKIKYIKTNTTVNDDDIQYVILASDGVWDALSIEEIKSCLNYTFNEDDQINKQSSNDDNIRNNDSDKIIPTNVNTFDNIHYNNKGSNDNYLYYYLIDRYYYIISDLFHEKLNSICHAIVYKSVNSNFWKESSIYFNTLCNIHNKY